MRYFIFALLLSVFSCDKTSKEIQVLKTDDLQIEQLTDHTYIHITFLETEDFGKVRCNGLIYIKNGEAVVFDTPTNDAVSQKLIDFIESSLAAKVSAVVINHFHNDCLGGLQAFHDRGISSYGSLKTIELAKTAGYTAPQIGFKNSLELSVGGKTIVNRFFGPAHTHDNIVSYIADEKVLFGGCMVKSLGAGKGFLGDANVNEWSNTIRAIRQSYPDLQKVVPGHGNAGGVDLLDYTIDMFDQ